MTKPNTRNYELYACMVGLTLPERLGSPILTLEISPTKGLAHASRIELEIPAASLEVFAKRLGRTGKIVWDD